MRKKINWTRWGRRWRRCARGRGNVVSCVAERRRKATKRINCVARLRHPSLTQTHTHTRRLLLATACVLFCFEGLRLLCVCVCVRMSYTCCVTEKKSRTGRTSAARKGRLQKGGRKCKVNEPASPVDGRANVESSSLEICLNYDLYLNLFCPCHSSVSSFPSSSCSSSCSSYCACWKAIFCLSCP